LSYNLNRAVLGAIKILAKYWQNTRAWRSVSSNQGETALKPSLPGNVAFGKDFVASFCHWLRGDL